MLALPPNDQSITGLSSRFRGPTPINVAIFQRLQNQIALAARGTRYAG